MKKNFKILFALLNKFLPILVSLIIIGIFLAVAGYFLISKDLPSPDGVINRQVSTSTTIYDRTGKTILYSVHGGVKRSLIQLADLPSYIKWAAITAEDRNFYQHGGFDVKGIIRSILVDIFKGGKVQGGSTITQQFVKNAILTSEKSYIRKVKELIISYQIEKKFSKDEILQMYFNEIPYGSVVYGIEAASQTYFGKSAKNLSVREAAVMAALPQAPTYYSPYGSHRDDLLGRADYIINQMVKDNHLTQAEADVALKQEIKFKPKQENILAPHFVLYVKELLVEKYGEDILEQEGLKVYTTLDWDLQQKAEQIIKEQVALNKKNWQANNAAAVVLDAKTGQILAMVGSADYFNEEIDGQVNVVLRPRQPGSSFKPIVYAAAFQKGYTPQTILFDLVTNFLNSDGTDYTPHNYNNKEYGPVTMKQALAGSLNIPAVKTIYLTGIDNVLNLADSLGYTTLKDHSRFGLSLVLGGGEVKLLEHAQTFSVFAQNGLLHPTTPILKVINKDDKTIEEFQLSEKKVLDSETTTKLNGILTDNSARAFVFGEKNYLTLPDRSVAAKTGTTNNFRDAWTMGFTPSITVGVWVGNSDNKVMKSGADGSQIAAPIWQKIMKEAVKNIPVEEFSTSTQTLTDKPILNGDYIINGQIHNILYYVNKDDPRGAIPNYPAEDPQFERWEEPVRKWAATQGFSTTNIPINQSTTGGVTIISPNNNATIKESQLHIVIANQANIPFTQTDYFIDDQLQKGFNEQMLEASLDVSRFNNGFHILKVVAYTSTGSIFTASLDFNLLK